MAVFGVVSGAVTILALLIYLFPMALRKWRWRARVVVGLMRRYSEEELRDLSQSGKYIRKLFAECGPLKQRARLLCHPRLMLRRTLAAANAIDITYYNRLRKRVGLPQETLPNLGHRRVPRRVGRIRDEMGSAALPLRELYGGLVDQYERDASALESQLPHGADYLFECLRPSFVAVSLAVSRRVGECLSEFDSATARLLLVVSKAGSGKTNFVCDLADRFLLPWDLPFLLLTGGNLRRLPVHGLEQRLPKSVLGDSYPGNLDDLLRSAEAICRRRGVPFTVILDGINEHDNLTDFAPALEHLVRRLLRSPSARVVITCRSEYFRERFQCLLAPQFQDVTQLVEDVHGEMSETQRLDMLAAYFSLFRIDGANLSEDVKHALMADPLLLRFFCEAYGDKNAASPAILPQMRDICRQTIFDRYLESKMRAIASRLPAAHRPGQLTTLPHLRVLRALALYMVQSQEVTDIPLAAVDEWMLTSVEDLLSEDLIIRRDLVGSTSVLGRREVLNFTYDEFRDYLLASVLVDDVWAATERRADFVRLAEALTAAGSPTAEGVSRYLFLRATSSDDPDLRRAIAVMPWYEEVFVDCIFAVEPTHISEDDIAMLRTLFLQSERNAREIMLRLLRNWTLPATDPLGMTLLLGMLDELAERQYDGLVRSAFDAGPPYARFDRVRFADFARQLIKIARSNDAEACERRLLLFEFASYLLPCRDEDYSRPAYEALAELAKRRPELAQPILEARARGRIPELAEMAGLLLDRLGELPPLPDEDGDTEKHQDTGSHAERRIRIGERGHIVRLPSILHESEFVRASGCVPSSPAAALSERMFACLLYGATDLRREYEGFYEREYDSLGSFLHQRYWVHCDTAEDICAPLSPRDRLFYRRASDGGDYQLAQYIEDKEGAEMVEMILARAAGEPK